jgi:hypothetical protein
VVEEEVQRDRREAARDARQRAQSARGDRTEHHQPRTAEHRRRDRGHHRTQLRQQPQQYEDPAGGATTQRLRTRAMPMGRRRAEAAGRRPAALA